MNDLNDLVPQVWYVDAETYDWLIWLLEQPPKDLPKLRELMEHKPMWEK